MSDAVARPTPPPSRLGAHVSSAVLAVISGAAAVAALAQASSPLATLGVAGDSPEAGVWVAVGAAALLGVTALGAMSSLGPVIVGGLLLLMSLARLLGVNLSLDSVMGGAPGLEEGFDLLLDLGVWLSLGLIVLAGGGAAHFARRAGRRMELDEERILDRASAETIGRMAKPRPPRSRIPAHVGSTVLAVLGLVVALGLLLAGLVDRTEGPAQPFGFLAVGAAVLLGLLTLTAAWSTLGVLVAGLLATIVGATGAIWTEALTEWASSWPTLADDPTIHRLLNAGAIAALGLTLVGVSIGAHGARRAGRRTQRLEIGVTRRLDER